MSFSNATPVNIAALALVSGLEALTAAAWLHCEEQSIPNPTNPLNVRWYGRAGQLRGPGATGVPGEGFAAYASANAGLADAWRMLVALAPSYGYDAVVAAAAGSDPLAQARAIELSSWAAGHYGGSATNAGCLRDYIHAHGGAPTEDPMAIVTVTPFPAGPRRFHIPGGATLNGYDPARPGAPVASVSVDAGGSAADADATVRVDWPGAPIQPGASLPGPIPRGGPFLRVTDGKLVGLLVAARVVTLDDAPAPPAPDDPAVDLAEQKAAVNAALDVVQAALAAARPT